MARFFVGQRVRKARGHCLGTTGTVSRFDTEGPPWDMVIRLDHEIRNEYGELLVQGQEAECLAHQWEPITNIDQTPAELTVEELLPFLKMREVS